MRVVIIGGGAAGFFAAITCAESNPDYEVILIEKSDKLLAKVKVSGGGRCNVTHACFEPGLLVQYYPRGHKALRGPFSRFQPKDTVQWFQSRGVALKTESDGRMFPASNSSQTIVDCLLHAATAAGVKIWKQTAITTLVKNTNHFELQLEGGKNILCDRVLIATGGHPKLSGFDWLAVLGHEISPPVPSLFTFNINDKALHALAGVALEMAKVKIVGTKLENEGPLLITHWGLSGPAILKLSALGARVLSERAYTFAISVSWMPTWSDNAILEKLNALKTSETKKLLHTFSPFQISLRLWHYLILRSGIPSNLRWADLSKKSMHVLAENLLHCNFNVLGKTTFKEEFVTCGGICLNDVNLKTMESLKCPGMYFAGEVLDVDGLTGGFNFQNAWTTGWLAGKAMAAANDTSI
jgi:predicted Rossmann fold flavoprotein